MEILRKRLETSAKIGRKIFVSLLLWVAFAGLPVMYAQDAAIRKVSKEDDKGKLTVLNIEFWDLQKNKLIKTIDLLHENPFVREGVKLLDRSGNGCPALDLRGKKISDFLAKEELSKYYPDRIHPEAGVQFGLACSRTSEPGKQYILLNYYLDLMSDDADLGAINDARIYDVKGKLIKQIPHYDKNFDDVKIEPKGRYIVHTFRIGDEYGSLYPEGFRVLDIEKNLYFEMLYPDMNTVTMGVNDAWVVCVKCFKADSCVNTLFYLDIAKGEFLKYEFSPSNTEIQKNLIDNTKSLAERIHALNVICPPKGKERMRWEKFESSWFKQIPMK
ncbi:MAG: hypothetical protein WCO63_14235 [Bacteroidota bacterium]